MFRCTVVVGDSGGGMVGTGAGAGARGAGAVGMGAVVVDGGSYRGRRVVVAGVEVAGVDVGVVDGELTTVNLALAPPHRLELVTTWSPAADPAGTVNNPETVPLSPESFR